MFTYYIPTQKDAPAARTLLQPNRT